MKKGTLRIIPRLDIKGPNLVKGVRFEGLRVLGKPEDFAALYYEQGADELYYQDAVASLYGRNSLLDIVARTADEIFIPLTVGGGLREVEDMRTVLRAGADKIAVNTAAVERPELISEAARTFGSSTIVVAIEAVRKSGGGWECCTDYGREITGKDAIEWAKEAEELGAGELIVTSIDQEGTGQGLDQDLIRTIAENATIPVIAGGGIGTPEHMTEGVLDGKADALSVASILHYECYKELAQKDADFSGEGNTEFLRGKRTATPSKVTPTDIGELKRHLIGQGIPCRPTGSVRDHE